MLGCVEVVYAPHGIRIVIRFPDQLVEEHLTYRVCGILSALNGQVKPHQITDPPLSDASAQPPDQRNPPASLQVIPTRTTASDHYNAILESCGQRVYSVADGKLEVCISDSLDIRIGNSREFILSASERGRSEASVGLLSFLFSCCLFLSFFRVSVPSRTSSKLLSHGCSTKTTHLPCKNILREHF
ncbi:hypothetical protein CVT26_011426 [Gymnopilus dilepis]|uniref:Uncharacterized protein n=1 Tax=Gymnopilus dilepis TaxID=231916 RepID=A0A409WZU0_9AGAR|nr:hypothetical protein CVT26_011426 [Gymnopilus dilepis]